MPEPDLAPGISLVIPAWNDSRRLKPTLDSIVPALDDSLTAFEILIVADGCSDGTGALVRSYANQNLRALEYPARLGKGGAILKGLEQARFSIAGFVDADLPVSPESLLTLASHASSSDAAIASRWAPGHRPRFHENAIRNLLSVAWIMLAKGMMLTSMRDTQCGAKFFKTDKLRAVLPNISIQSWAFDLELLYLWHAAGFRCVEVSVPWTDGGGSRLVLRKAVPLMFASLVGLRMLHSPIGRRAPQKLRTTLRAKFRALASGFT